jgi:PAS domain S-box-containing protein
MGLLLIGGLAVTSCNLIFKTIFRSDIANPVAETFTLLMFAAALFFYSRDRKNLALNLVFCIPLAVYFYYLAGFSNSDAPRETILYTLSWLITGLTILALSSASSVKMILYGIVGLLTLTFHGYIAGLLGFYFSIKQTFVQNPFLIFLYLFLSIILIRKIYFRQIQHIREEKTNLELNIKKLFQQIRQPLAKINVVHDAEGNITRMEIEKINHAFESEFKISLQEAKNQEINYLFNLIFRNDTNWNDLLIIHPVTCTELNIPSQERWYNLHFQWSNKDTCFCLFFDITSEKQSLQHLEDTKARYLTLLEAIPDVFFVIDQDGIFQDVVFKGQDKFYLEVTELIGNNLFNVGFSEIMAQKIFQCLHKTIEKDTIESIEYSLETKDATLLFEMRLAKLDDKSVIAISRDITRRKKAEFELEIAKTKAEEAIALKSRFLANLSHDIRTPVNIMIGLTKLLAEPLVSEEEKSDFIQDVQLQGNLLLQMIENTVQLSKIETNTLEINFSYTNIHQLLRELYNTFYPLMPDNRDLQLKMSAMIRQDEVGFETEPTLLKEVFMRLLDNAIKFTIQGIIRFGYETDKGNSILFFVEDTGPGIPDNEKEQIFLRFYVIESDRLAQKSGSGLGLPIAQHFVALLGGELLLTSVPGKGSRFWFRLPLKNSKGFLKILH